MIQLFFDAIKQMCYAKFHTAVKLLESDTAIRSDEVRLHPVGIISIVLRPIYRQGRLTIVHGLHKIESTCFPIDEPRPSATNADSLYSYSL